MAALREGLRNPLTTSIRPKVVSQAVRGGIDWGATVRHRAGAGAAGATLFVVRPARRVFDTPENRALAYALEQLDIRLRRVAPASTNERTGVHDKGWFGDIVDNAVRVREARRHHWLRDVPAEPPDARTRQRLRAARTTFYRHRIPAVIDLLERYSSPSPEDITDLLPSATSSLNAIGCSLRLPSRCVSALGHSPTAARRSGRAACWWERAEVRTPVMACRTVPKCACGTRLGRRTLALQRTRMRASVTASPPARRARTSSSSVVVRALR